MSYRSAFITRLLARRRTRGGTLRHPRVEIFPSPELQTFNFTNPATAGRDALLETLRNYRCELARIDQAIVSLRRQLAQPSDDSLEKQIPPLLAARDRIARLRARRDEDQKRKGRPS